MSQRDGCPDGMYPLDLDYADSEEFDTFEDFAERAEAASNILNVPLSWWFDDNRDSDDDADGLRLIFAMPRKSLRTWAIRLTAVGDRRDEIEQWLRDFTKRELTTWFGWGG